MQRFLNPEFKEFIYDKFYKLCEETLKYVIEKEEFLNKYRNDWAMDGVDKIYYNKEFTDFKRSYFPGKKEDHGYFDQFWDDIITYEVKTFVEELITWAKPTSGTEDSASV